MLIIAKASWSALIKDGVVHLIAMQCGGQHIFCLLFLVVFPLCQIFMIFYFSYITPCVHVTVLHQLISCHSFEFFAELCAIQLKSVLLNMLRYFIDFKWCVRFYDIELWELCEFWEFWQPSVW